MQYRMRPMPKDGSITDGVKFLREHRVCDLGAVYGFVLLSLKTVKALHDMINGVDEAGKQTPRQTTNAHV